MACCGSVSICAWIPGTHAKQQVLWHAFVIPQLGIGDRWILEGLPIVSLGEISELQVMSDALTKIYIYFIYYLIYIR